MPTLNKRQVLARWKKLAEDRSSGAWTEAEDVSGLLEKFLPDGDGCEAIFEGIERGDEVCQRLREVYKAVRRSEPGGLYLIPTPAKAPTRAAVTKLLKEHFARLREICAAIDNQEGVALLAKLPKIEFVDQEPETTDAGRDQESYFVDVRIDFLEACRGSKSQALLLEEALYEATTSPAVQDYVLWPLRREGSRVEEPFQPEFELWKAGVTWRWRDDRTLAVHVSQPEPAKKPGQAKTGKAKSLRDYPVQAALARLATRDHNDEKHYQQRIAADLQSKKVVLGSLCSPVRMLGLARGETAVEQILNGNAMGWSTLQGAFRCFAWDYRIQTACKQKQLNKKLAKNPWVVFRVDEGDAISSLCMAIALLQDAFADFCGDRLLRNFIRGDLLNKEMEWDGAPAAPFMALLYARWRNREAELRKKPVKGCFESLAKDRPHFRAMVDQWDHDKPFAKAFHTACDAACEDAEAEHGPMFFWAFPAELLAIARVRRELGRPDPLADHPLGQSPLGQLPNPLPKPPKDKFFEESVAKCQKAYPKLPLTPPW